MHRSRPERARFETGQASGRQQLTRDKVTDSRLELELVDPSCDIASESCGVTSSSSAVSWSIRPEISVATQLGFVQARYAFAIDPTDAKDRTHLLSLQLGF